MADVLSWPGNPFWSPEAPAASARPPPPGSPRWAPGRITGRDPARAEAAAAASAPRAGRPEPSMLSPAHPVAFRPGCAVSPLRCLAPTRGSMCWSTTSAGFSAHRHVTADGLERHLRAEPPGAVPADQPAADRLTASAPARIVTVSSTAHARGRIDFDDLQGERNYSGQRAYSQSKLASVMFTYELARAAWKAPA